MSGIAWHVEKLDVTSSTNELVKRAIEQGEPEGKVYRARAQTGGYGRQGRIWSSPEGGMYQSLLLRPQAAPAKLPTIGLVVALAVREALVALAGQARIDGNPIMLKWPNDVVCAKGKLVGISAEAHAGGVCIGIGANVRRPENEQPVGGKYLPAYLEDFRNDIGIDEVGDEILRAFSGRYGIWKREGFAAFKEEFNSYDRLCGRKVEISHPDGDVFLAGVASGIDAQGCLLVRSGGRIDQVTSGEAHISQALI